MRMPTAPLPRWRADFALATFLRRDWQQRPRLIRQAWPGWRNPLALADLIALAGADSVEARLISCRRQRWQIDHGPFSAARFAALPRRHWTLLVQAVDHHVPAVARLLDGFRFIPDWRIDDVMVSYAVDGGGVGPHFDQYDVFLLQGAGQRRWQVGARCDRQTPLAAHDELRLLANFEARQEWLLEPGDMLYLPPRYAHHGVAVGTDCMTYSIGLRAPSRAELLGHWCDYLIDRLDDDDRYVDGALTPTTLAGEIDQTTLAALHAMVSERLRDRAAFADWFGRYATERKYAEVDPVPARPLSRAQLTRRLAAGACLLRAASSRYALVREPPALFVDGQRFALCGAALRLAALLCADGPRALRSGDVRAAAALALATALYAQGSLVFAHDS